MLKKQHIEYYDGNVLLEGYCVYDDKQKEKKPAVLVSHDWTGRNEFACQKAEQLAAMGYVGFALDMYGKGKIAQSKEEKSAFIQPFIKDRTKLLQRITAAFNTVKNLEIVNNHHIAVIGFCFGGLCVLDLARSGANLSGVVSFHGLLMPPENVKKENIKAKVLALHGYEDPMVSKEQLTSFEEEMTKNKVDWQIVIYGNAKHAFTNPQANDQVLGTVYEKHAAERSWIAMQDFLKEVFELSPVTS